MKKLLLVLILTTFYFECYGQEIHRNPYKTICEMESGVTFEERVNLADESRIELEKQLEKAQTEAEKEYFKKVFGEMISSKEKMEKDGCFIISVPEFELEGYSTITFSATREEMMSLLKVLSTGDFRDGDFIKQKNVRFTYSEKTDKFTVSKTEWEVTSVGFVHRNEFKEMYEKMKELLENSASN